MEVVLHLLCSISSGRGQHGVNVVGTLSQLLGVLTPVEFNNRNVVEDSTFYIIPAIFFNVRSLLTLRCPWRTVRVLMARG